MDNNLIWGGRRETPCAGRGAAHNPLFLIFIHGNLERLAEAVKEGGIYAEWVCIINFVCV